MKNKPKNIGFFLNTLKWVKDYWFLSVPLGGLVTFAVAMCTLPNRVAAVEKKTTSIEQYIQAEQRTQELIKKAPPGYVWDTKTEEFVPDPNAKKKGK